MPTYQATQQADQLVLIFDVGQWLLDTAVLMAGEAGKTVVSPVLSWLAGKDVSTKLTFTIPLINLPTQTKEIAEIEPQLVLDEITQAINQAEKNLGKNNFVIASGQVETSTIMRNSEGEQISAHITFQIMPKEEY